VGAKVRVGVIVGIDGAAVGVVCLQETTQIRMNAMMAKNLIFIFLFPNE
jgi:hypothetical protein